MMKMELFYPNQNLKRGSGYGPCTTKIAALPTVLTIKEEEKKEKIVIAHSSY